MPPYDCGPIAIDVVVATVVTSLQWNSLFFERSHGAFIILLGSLLCDDVFAEAISDEYVSMTMSPSLQSHRL